MPVDPRRGEVWMIGLEPVVGQELHSHGFTRPCIVISSNSIRKRQIRTIVPLTGWQEKFADDPLLIPILATPTNGLDKDSAADSTQLRSVSLDRFDLFRGIITADDLEAITLAVGLVIEHP